MTSTNPRQLSFDEIRRARAEDPQTSKAAARRSHGLAAAHRAAILRVLGQGGEWTAGEIAAAAGLQSLQVSRRLAELRDDGEIEATALLRPTETGRMAGCWRLA